MVRGGASGDKCVYEKVLRREESTFKYPIPLGAYSDRPMVEYLGRRMILSKADARSVELLTESVYSQKLGLGETLDVNDGNKLEIKEVGSPHGHK